ncbi:tyrosine-type recombinase/integrase [Robbsia sp. Bb-Pol-6]|uniref:Tyrosine-type recombinase/integrase n=1 Tax=Robbsia betulipollinis TaxID=2981849 RepID=A0ABT3ZPP7_9BURK|nr:integrase arm-type DNA-binding domain-containing protein [Robbsia betulipollinis]MCY0388247.1 tyrosine-type recombinase/integrase [Robbsia betulipollinis]
MLTDIQCRNAKPKDRPYKLTDGKGLYLEVKPNGTRAWRYRFELAGKESILAIGDYPAVSLSDARVARQKARDQVKEGISPVHARQLERIKREQAHAQTFEQVAREWLALKDWTAETKARRLDTLQRIVFPSIGKLGIASVTSAHVLRILQKTAKTAPTVAAEARRAMSGVFELAISTLRAETDPVYPVRRAIPPSKTQHKRALGVDEIGQLMRDLTSHESNFQTVGAFRLMWATLCRPSEAIEAEWSEFDLESATWTIPAERMKKRQQHVVPLPSQTVAMLAGIRGVNGNTRHVFPHRDDRKKPMTTASQRGALKALGWATKYSPHATRTTGSTRLNEMGYPCDWVERQLAHVEPNAVRRTYNQAQHLDDRRRMMQAWADMLDALEAGGKVIPGNFRRTA